MPEPEQCGNCKNWMEHRTGHGHCRRYPPVVLTPLAASQADLNQLVGSQEPPTWWPHTLDTEWCAEYKKLT